MNTNEVEESVVAKSTGKQDEKDMATKDALLSGVLSSKRKLSKSEADYREQESSSPETTKCTIRKFNLADEKKCHIVEGEIANNGISKYFSPKGDGMLPGDIVWDFIKKTGRKLECEEGYVINKGAERFQCKDCKYYMYSENCLLIKGTFGPEMSCGFIVKIGNGTEI
jgi:hypothetical protein